MTNEDSYRFGIITDLGPAEAETRMREALAAEGFGILTEIDVYRFVAPISDQQRRRSSGTPRLPGRPSIGDLAGQSGSTAKSRFAF